MVPILLYIDAWEQRQGCHSQQTIATETICFPTTRSTIQMKIHEPQPKQKLMMSAAAAFTILQIVHQRCEWSETKTSKCQLKSDTEDYVIVDRYMVCQKLACWLCYDLIGLLQGFQTGHYPQKIMKNPEKHLRKSYEINSKDN